MSLHFQCTWRQFNSGNAKNNVRSNCKDVFPQSVRGLLTVDSHTHKDPAFSRVLTRLRGFFSTLSGMWTIDQIGWWFTSHVKKCAGKNSRNNDKKPISDSPNYLDVNFLVPSCLTIFYISYPRFTHITQQQRIFPVASIWGCTAGIWFIVM